MELLDEVASQYSSGFENAAKQFTVNGIKKGLGVLLDNAPAIVGRVGAALAANPLKLEALAEAVEESDRPAVAIMMPTPPGRPLPNPLGAFELPRKINFGGSVELPVTVYFGHGGWFGRFLRVGVFEKRLVRTRPPLRA